MTQNQANPETPDPRPLWAYADGELDDAQRADVTERLAEDREAAREVLTQQRLKQAVGRAMTSTSPAPASLRSTLAELAATVPADEPESTSVYTGPPVIARIGRWAPAAVAAVLFIAALVTLQVANPSQPGVDTILPPQQVSDFARRHVQCSTFIDSLVDDPSLPKQVTELPGALHERFGAAPRDLDLTGLGYGFAGVGKCTLPGEGAVHLVYRGLPDSGHDDRLSLWIIPDTGQYDLEDGRVYTLAGDQSAHPLLLWKTGPMLYYLSGDTMPQMQQAAEALRQRT